MPAMLLSNVLRALAPNRVVPAVLQQQAGLGGKWGRRQAIMHLPCHDVINGVTKMMMQCRESQDGGGYIQLDGGGGGL